MYSVVSWAFVCPGSEALSGPTCIRPYSQPPTFNSGVQENTLFPFCSEVLASSSKRDQKVRRGPRAWQPSKTAPPPPPARSLPFGLPENLKTKGMSSMPSDSAQAQMPLMMSRAHPFRNLRFIGSIGAMMSV